MDLLVEIYSLTEKFPKHEIYGLTGQMRRAVISVPSNIAEGHTREHRKEYLHHVSVAQASLAELDTQLEAAARLKYASAEGVRVVGERVTSVGKQLYALRNALLQP